MMAIDWKWPGFTWFASAAENAAIAFCATVVGVFAANGWTSISQVNWGHTLDVAGFASLGVFLAAVVALRVKNGTASFNPNVVAKPDTAPSA